MTPAQIDSLSRSHAHYHGGGASKGKSKRVSKDPAADLAALSMM